MDLGNLWCLLGVHRYKILDGGPYEIRHKGRLVELCHYYDLRCDRCGDVHRKVVRSK
ncbi:hypothetical protein PaCe_00047 [Pseudomonas phage vB_PaeP_PaCe]|uniref:Uncharacterized protein n=3 Tax=Viruses TaxID=10239 RepID=L7TM75_9CAUD|nr:hypothetical protein AVU27_gp60 [Pseudomonas phage DL54]YP_009638998.1 hypothetical protein FGG60_gp12 [Pseudomonas phage PaP4]URG14334.1 hypothetical protein PaCe_00047 [Pseudomonas phage vB_PaeP_PaCe]WPJ69111.1 hypothetical protein PACQ9_61 [Pseudomonas phage PA_CQ9]AGC35243.1 hypothetical protein PaP4_012 [Pseudomonas phage PaP4]AKF13815.1 hypothetical protein [Pseudomonas phage DL54]